MIKTFADRRTEDLFLRGVVRGWPPDVVRRAVRKLEYVDLAICLDDLRTPPGNRLHSLKADRRGRHAIAVNDQWRVCFRFVDGDADDVEVCDYH
jgi:toxin HigB-1